MESTLVMIKPNGLKKKLLGEIISRFEKSKLTVERIQLKNLTQKQAESFYKEHKGKHFYQRLIKFMTSGKIAVMIISGKKAIKSVREIAGATNPKEALAGTIRSDYATNTTENIIHASDSIKSAQREIKFYFKDYEIS